MEHVAPGLSAAQVLVLANNRGGTVSAEQFERWRKAGLLPKPRVRGRGRGHGVEALYPWITVYQVEAIAMILDKVRDLDAVAWALWWCGYPVTELVRRSLGTKLRALLKASRHRLAVFRGPPPDVGPDPLTELRDRRPPRSWGKLRRQIGKEDFLTVARMVHEFRMGEFERNTHYDTVDLTIAARAFAAAVGIAKPRKLTAVEAHELAELLQVLSTRANLRTIGAAIASADTNVLEDARDNFRALAAMTVKPPPNIFFPSMGEFIAWLGVDRAVPRFGFLLKRAAKQLPDWNQARLTPLQRLAQEFPGLAHVFDQHGSPRDAERQ